MSFLIPNYLHQQRGSEFLMIGGRRLLREEMAVHLFSGFPFLGRADQLFLWLRSMALKMRNFFSSNPFDCDRPLQDASSTVPLSSELVTTILVTVESGDGV